ncbi:hypothetical protein, partial [Aneurinibacillus danicus]|uniref:hypothetical protein n=1 Tax=Aneurinibacillus danicus TaxID=267746 RepID=UPI001C3FF5A1
FPSYLWDTSTTNRQGREKGGMSRWLRSTRKEKTSASGVPHDKVWRKANIYVYLCFKLGKK